MTTTFNELYDKMVSYGYNVSREIKEQINEGEIWMELTSIDLKPESIDNSSYVSTTIVTFQWIERDPGTILPNVVAFLVKLGTDKWMENRFTFEPVKVRRVGQTYRIGVPVKWVDANSLP
jgi:hypothetical protein